MHDVLRQRILRKLESLPEDLPKDPINPYGNTKLAGPLKLAVLIISQNHLTPKRFSHVLVAISQHGNRTKIYT